MDRICSALIEKINTLTGVGRYVIISEDEFLECFAEGEEPAGGELKKALKELISEGYIDLKYSSGNMFCVAPLKKYAAEDTDETEEIIQPEQPVQIVTEGGYAGLKTFAAAFAGGMAGSLIISLIFAFV